MNEIEQVRQSVKDISLSFDREIFVSSFLEELMRTLGDLVGQEEASGLVSVVGEKIGNNINSLYKEALRTGVLTAEQVAAVLEDLKARIKGDFYLISMDDEKIVLGNRRCPFGEAVIGNDCLCMMTSNVFGVIVSQNLDYGQVELKKTIAQQHKECLINIYLKPQEQDSIRDGIEYFKS